MRAIAVLALVFALVPAAASAVTVADVIALSKSGVSEDVILALIERDKTIFTIDSEQLVALKREGVSETVVLAMLKSGRQQPSTPQTATPDAPAAPAASPPGDGLIGPNTIVVGHGPDYPDTFHSPGYFVDPSPVIMPFAYYIPLPSFGGGCVPTSISASSYPVQTGGRFGRFMSDPGARFLNDGAQRFLNNGFITQQTLPSLGGCVPASPLHPLRGARPFGHR